MTSTNLAWLEQTPRPAAAVTTDVVVPLSTGAGKLRLFCLPCAGGRAAGYRHFDKLLPTSIDVFVLQAPAPRERSWERIHDSLSSLVDALSSALRPYLDRPIAFLGHSMGAIVAYELSRRLLLEGHPPAALFAVAARAPHVPPRRLLHELSDTAMWTAIRELGGIAPELLEDPSLAELLIPGIRRDLAVCEKRLEEPQPLPLPIAAFQGIRDASVLESDMLAWRELTSEGFRLRRVAGNHFCTAADQNAAEIARAVAGDLSSIVQKEG